MSLVSPSPFYEELLFSALSWLGEGFGVETMQMATQSWDQNGRFWRAMQTSSERLVRGRDSLNSGRKSSAKWMVLQTHSAL